ncbi:hypothetical protein HK102_011340 [Quaeritorhiza haematococci]|nr:hypothetical protein HK102_011340 [Quaeritorhiza haematococci]
MPPTTSSSLSSPLRHPNPQADSIRRLIYNSASSDKVLLMPCCFDPLSAKLIQAAGFPLTFMSGYAVSASKGVPDTGLLSYAEMVDQARDITQTVQIPCIGDGDTGYGNALNIRRTVQGYAAAGLGGIMIEDQVSPKRCGHTRDKAVVSREKALLRVKAAVDARNEGQDIFIIARTDARIISLQEAIERCKLFREIGADMTFLEAPRSVEEMVQYCRSVEGPKLANMLEHGKTPILPPKLLKQMGYTIAAYPLTLISSAIKAMRTALEALKSENPDEVERCILPFSEVCEIVGFEEYYQMERRYKL